MSISVLKSKSSKSPDVWNFTDYRAYLHEHLQFKRDTVRGFSVRQFCLKANLSTENYVLRIIRGKKKLGPKLVENFVSALSLKGTQAEYFRKLVHLDLTKNLDERQLILECLERLRKRASRAAPLLDQSILRRWYVSVIWELASCPGGIKTPASVAKALKYKVSVQEVKEAIEYLKNNRYLIERRGSLIQSEQLLMTSDGKFNPILRLHHKEMVELAHSAVDWPIDERGFFGLTIAISKQKLPEVKNQIRKFIESLHSQYVLDPSADTVYRLNCHVFPLASHECPKVSTQVNFPGENSS